MFFYKDLSKTDIDVCELAGAANGNGAAENEYAACANTCLTHEVQGPPGSDERCTFTAVNSTYHTCTCQYRAILKSDNAGTNFTSEFPAFLASGIRGAAGGGVIIDN